MKRFAAPRRNQKQDKQPVRVPPKELVRSAKQVGPSQAAVVEKVVYFFKGPITDFEIVAFPFVRAVKEVDYIWCIFINDEYIEQQEAIVAGLEALGLVFIHEFSYMGSFGKMYQIAEDFFRNTNFWKTLTLQKIKTREQFLKTI